MNIKHQINLNLPSNPGNLNGGGEDWRLRAGSLRASGLSITRCWRSRWRSAFLFRWGVFGGDSLQIDYISILAFFKKKNPTLQHTKKKRKQYSRRKKTSTEKRKKVKKHWLKEYANPPGLQRCYQTSMNVCLIFSDLTDLQK